MILLLAADAVLVGLNLAYYDGRLIHEHFALDTERGYGEFFLDIKSLWAGMLFALIFLAKRQLAYAVAAVLFLYLVVDDALRVHELMGLRLIEPLNLQPVFGLRARDLGELIFSLSVGLTVITLGAVGYRFGDAVARRVCIHLLVGIGLLAVFGIGVDMAHVAVGQDNPTVDMWFVVAEDGGEVVMFSFFAWYAFGLLNYLTHGWRIGVGMPNP